MLFGALLPWVSSWASLVTQQCSSGLHNYFLRGNVLLGEEEGVKGGDEEHFKPNPSSDDLPNADELQHAFFLCFQF